jgi:hypothetical protein
VTVNTYTVTDETGTLLAGAEVSQQNTKGWCGLNPVDGYTDSSGVVKLDDGCYTGATGTWTVSAPGYQSKSGTFNAPWPGGANVSVALSSVASAPVDGLCPPGYVDQGGECVQAASSNWGAILGQTIKANWLLITVLLVVVALVAAMLWRPKAFSSAVGAASGAASNVSSGASTAASAIGGAPI